VVEAQFCIYLNEIYCKIPESKVLQVAVDHCGKLETEESHELKQLAGYNAET